MRVSKWGDGLAVLLPAAVVKALDLREGDEVDIEVVGRRRLDVGGSEADRHFVERLRRFRGSLPSDFKFDRPDANVRE